MNQAKVHHQIEDFCIKVQVNIKLGFVKLIWGFLIKEFLYVRFCPRVIKEDQFNL